jgi:prepilin-type N-terminal cleavage/methylation domain-containing protein
VKQSTRGFTIVEVLVAVVVLGIGVVAMAGSSALVTRMIGRGQRATRASQVMAERLDSLRLLANKSTPHCTDPKFVGGGLVTSPLGVTETWTIQVTGPKTRLVTETVTYRNAQGRTHTDVLTTIIGC